MARSFISATSRCASADFTTFPLSAFRAMAEMVGEVDGVGDAGGNGGRSAALSASIRRGRRRRFVKME